MTQTQMVGYLVEKIGIDKKQANLTLDELNTLVVRELNSKTPFECRKRCGTFGSAGEAVLQGLAGGFLRSAANCATVAQLGESCDDAFQQRSEALAPAPRADPGAGPAGDRRRRGWRR